MWILICNVIVQLVNIPLEGAGLHSWTWTIFLANVLFFIKSNPDHKAGLLENALGGIFGLLGAMGLYGLIVLLGGFGVPALVSTILAIAIFLFLTIVLNPVVPYVFNNNALCFFLVALNNSECIGNVLAHPFLHIGGVIIGNLIVNVGTVLIVECVAKMMAKKKA